MHREKEHNVGLISQYFLTETSTENNINIENDIDCDKSIIIANATLNPFIITKARLYNFDPLKPNFYTVKLGFTVVYIIFLMLLKNLDCGTR